MRIGREADLMGVVGACAAAGKMPPPGWTPRNEEARTGSVSNVKRYGQSTSQEFPAR